MLNKVPVEMIDYDFSKTPSLDNVYTKDQTYSKDEVYNKTEIDTKLEDVGGLDYVNKAWTSNSLNVGWLIFSFEQDTDKSDAITRAQAIIEGTGWGGVTGGAPFKLSIYGIFSGDGSQWAPSCTLLTNGETSKDHPVCYQKDGKFAKIGIWLGTGSAGFVRAKSANTADGKFASIKDVTLSGNTNATPPLKYRLPVESLGGGGGAPEMSGSKSLVLSNWTGNNQWVTFTLETASADTCPLTVVIEGQSLNGGGYSNTFQITIAGNPTAGAEHTKVMFTCSDMDVVRPELLLNKDGNKTQISILIGTWAPVKCTVDYYDNDGFKVTNLTGRLSAIKPAGFQLASLSIVKPAGAQKTNGFGKYADGYYSVNSSRPLWVVLEIAIDNAAASSNLSTVIEGNGWGGSANNAPFRLNIAGTPTNMTGIVIADRGQLAGSEACYSVVGNVIKIGVYLAAGPSVKYSVVSVDGSNMSFYPIKSVNATYAHGATKPFPNALPVKSIIAS